MKVEVWVCVEGKSRSTRKLCLVAVVAVQSNELKSDKLKAIRVRWAQPRAISAVAVCLSRMNAGSEFWEWGYLAMGLGEVSMFVELNS